MAESDSVTQCWQILVLKRHGSTSTLLGYNLVLHMGQLYSGQTRKTLLGVWGRVKISARGGGELCLCVRYTALGFVW